MRLGQAGYSIVADNEYKLFKITTDKQVQFEGAEQDVILTVQRKLIHSVNPVKWTYKKANKWTELPIYLDSDGEEVDLSTDYSQLLLPSDYSIMSTKTQIRAEIEDVDGNVYYDEISLYRLGDATGIQIVLSNEVAQLQRNKNGEFNLEDLGFSYSVYNNRTKLTEGESENQFSVKHVYADGELVKTGGTYNISSIANTYSSEQQVKLSFSVNVLGEKDSIKTAYFNIFNHSLGYKPYFSTEAPVVTYEVDGNVPKVDIKIGLVKDNSFAPIEDYSVEVLSEEALISELIREADHYIYRIEGMTKDDSEIVFSIKSENGDYLQKTLPVKRKATNAPAITFRLNESSLLFTYDYVKNILEPSKEVEVSLTYGGKDLFTSDVLENFEVSANTSAPVSVTKKNNKTFTVSIGNSDLLLSGKISGYKVYFTGSVKIKGADTVPLSYNLSINLSQSTSVLDDIVKNVNDTIEENMKEIEGMFEDAQDYSDGVYDKVKGELEALEADPNTITINGVHMEDGTVGAEKIVAKSITAGQIEAGAIDAGLIKAEAVEAKAIKADSAFFDKLTTSEFWSESVNAAEINAGSINTGTLSADRIEAGSIEIGKLAEASFDQDANGIVRAKTMSSAISASEKSILLSVESTYETLESQKNKITNVDVLYAQSTSQVVAPSTGWQSEAPAYVEGQYIWTKTIKTFGSGATQTEGPVCMSGSTGLGVKTIQEYYYWHNSTTVAPPSNAKWETSPGTWREKEYLWTRTYVEYTDGTNSTTAEICVSGAPGADGDNSKTVSISGEQVFKYREDFGELVGPANITLYASVQGVDSPQYLWKVKPSGGSWTTLSDKTANLSILPTGSVWGSAKSLVYRCELSPTIYDEFTITKVSDGATGNGISSIKNFYLATSAGSGITNTSPGFSESITSTTEANKYLWSYELITYSNGQTQKTVAIIIGTHGTSGSTGRGISSIKEEYQAHSSGTAAPTGAWSTTIPTLNNTNKKYLWNRETINYTTGTPTTETFTKLIAVYGDDGEDAYSVILSNENHTYAVESNGQPSADVSTTTTISVYKGTEKVSASVGAITTGTSGLTTSLSGSTITITMTKSVNASATSGSFTIPVSANGLNFEKTFSWSKAIKGATGSQGPTGVHASYVLISGDQAFKYATGASTPSPTSINLTAQVFNLSGGGQWYYRVPGSTTNTTISGAITTSYNLSPSASFWGSNKSLTFRYQVGDRYDEITVAKVEDGAVGPQGPQGNTGSTGKGVKATEITYQASSSGTVVPTGTWSTTIPSVSAGQYLWTRTRITYTDNTFSDTFSVGMMGQTGATGSTGAAGVGVSSATVTYQASGSGTSAPTGTWSSSVPNVSAGQYLWTRTVTAYTSGNSTTAYAVARMGVDGSAGRGISSIENFYLASSASSGVTTSTSGWTSSVQSMTTTNKYLWNYEKISYTDNSAPTTTAPTIIGVHGTNGSVGADGNSITSIIEYYLATSASSGVTTGTSGWTTSVQTMTASNKYLWNYEVIKYSKAADSIGTPKVIGVFGNTGSAGADAYTVLLGNESHSFPVESNGHPSSTVSTTTEVIAFKGASAITPSAVSVSGAPTGITTSVSGAKVTINMGTSSPSATSGTFNINATVDGKSFAKVFSWSKAIKGATGATGPTGSAGISITAVDVEYGVSSSSTTAPTSWSTTTPSWTDGQYIWSRTKTTYSSGSPTYSKPACITGGKGSTGASGTDGKGIKSTAVTYQASSSGTAAPTGTWSTSIPSVSAGQYLWTRTVITYTDNSTSTSYSVGMKGATGATGSTGNGVSSAAVTYQRSSSGTTPPTGSWVTSVPAESSDTPYLWTRTITTYTNGTTSTAYAVASLGKSVSAIAEEYYLSTSKTTQSGGSWASTPPTWTAGKYMWTRSKITYVNPSSVAYTTPYCDSSWEAIDGIEIGGRNLVRDSKLRSGKGFLPSYKLSTEMPTEETEYTLSFEYEQSTTVGAGIALGTSSGWDGKYFTLPPMSAPKGTYKTTVKLIKDSKTHLYFYSNDASCKVIDMKLEKGNKATDWTPAPEDMQHEMDVAYGLNQWKRSRYDGIQLASGTAYPTFNDISGRTPSAEDVLDDNTNLILNLGGTDYFIAHLRTNVYVPAAKSITLTPTSAVDDTASFFLNGIKVSDVESTQVTTLALKAGWNSIDILFYEHTGGVGFSLDKKLSDHVEKMGYAIGYVSGPSKVEVKAAVDIAANEINIGVNQTITNNIEKQNYIAMIPSGKMLYPDETFRSDINSVQVYNNGGNSNVSRTRIVKPSDAPTNSTHAIEMKHVGAASPGLGGFVQIVNTKANAIYVQKFIAKLPVGYNLNHASNATGDDSSHYFVGPNSGTGKYETYYVVRKCGATGSFSSTGHIYVTGATPTSSAPLVWYLASATAIDVTDLVLQDWMNSTNIQLTPSEIVNTVSSGVNNGTGIVTASTTLTKDKFEVKGAAFRVVDSSGVVALDASTAGELFVRKRMQIGGSAIGGTTMDNGAIEIKNSSNATIFHANKDGIKAMGTNFSLYGSGTSIGAGGVVSNNTSSFTFDGLSAKFNKTVNSTTNSTTSISGGKIELWPDINTGDKPSNTTKMSTIDSEGLRFVRGFDHTAGTEAHYSRTSMSVPKANIEGHPAFGKAFAVFAGGVNNVPQVSRFHIFTIHNFHEGVHGLSFALGASRSYNYGNNETYSLVMNSTYRSCIFSLLSGKVNSERFLRQIVITYSGSTAYVYADINDANPVNNYHFSLEPYHTSHQPNDLKIESHNYTRVATVVGAECGVWVNNQGSNSSVYTATVAPGQDGYLGLMGRSNSASDWIRTPESGLIPYQSGGHGSLGSTSWPFGTLNVETINFCTGGALSGYSSIKNQLNMGSRDIVFDADDSGDIVWRHKGTENGRIWRPNSGTPSGFLFRPTVASGVTCFLEANGKWTAYGYNTASSISLKTDPNQVNDNAVNELFNNVEIKDFYYKDNIKNINSKMVGPIIEDILPDAHSELLINDSHTGLKIDNAVWLTWRKSQMQDSQIAEAYELISELYEENKNLKERLDKLEELVATLLP